MNIPKRLREGILEATNESKIIKVDPDYTTFTSDSGKAVYSTNSVRGVVEYIAGRLPRDIDPVMAVSYTLKKMRDLYKKLGSDIEKPKRPERLYPEFD